jgi:hypothetical protein
MQTKLSTVQDAFVAGDFKKAIAIAAKFHDLGKERNAILDAHTAFTNPRWVVGLGKSVDDCIALGIAALRTRYGFSSGE